MNDARIKKRVTLRGQQWFIRDDGYRFWCAPAESNPLIDRNEYCMMEYKHCDSPANELAQRFFSDLKHESRREK